MSAFNNSNNLFGQIYELSPLKSGLDAYKSYQAGQTGMAVALGVASLVDFGPLFRTFGKEYASVARSYLGKFTIEQLGSCTPLCVES
jgi:hypothetical protein